MSIYITSKLYKRSFEIFLSDHYSDEVQ